MKINIRLKSQRNTANGGIWQKSRFSRELPETTDYMTSAFQGHSRSSEPTRIDPSPMTSY